MVNVWSDNNKIDGMASYLKRLNHPLFQFEKRVNYPVFNAATIAATNELPMYASLPKKSLRGITSSTHAEFAREVMGGAADEDDCVEIGKIFHMGKTEPAKVHLSKGSLRGHLFVAGSTVSGKSNFSYGLLSGLYKDGIKFMVIEPAEGVNLREMSLEMITNAIEEMRTYGEGFIIADQSPALMDPAVIRNTNTEEFHEMCGAGDIAFDSFIITDDNIRRA